MDLRIYDEEVNVQFPLHTVFLALPLEGPAKWQFHALQEVLKPYEDILRFQNPQSPHLTLQFWKEVMEIEYKPIVEKSKEIAGRSEPFTLQVTEAGTFGERGNNRVIFLSIAFSPALATLKKLCPWPNRDDGFHPHITLARIDHQQRFAVAKKKIMKELENCTFDIPVDRLRLYAEIDGRKQTVIGEYVFYGKP